MEKANILIVDDTPDNVRLLMEMLSERGYKVRPATSGAHALTTARLEPPDLILLDILMPDMDGLAFQAAAQQQGEKTPIVVLTADIQETTRRECQRLGATAIEYKPLSPLAAEPFLEMVERIIRSKGGATI